MTKKLYRSNDNKIIAGILGGVGEYYEIDPTILRLGYVGLAVLTGGFPFVVAYIIALVVVPHKPV